MDPDLEALKGKLSPAKVEKFIREFVEQNRIVLFAKKKSIMTFTMKNVCTVSTTFFLYLYIPLTSVIFAHVSKCLEDCKCS